jgi:hypothetical protein
VGEGIELSKRARHRQLGISVNEEFDGKLAMVRGEPQRIPLESFRLTLLGPFKEDLEDLRKEWNAWLREHGDEVKRIRAEMAADTDRLVAGDVDGFRSAMALRASELGDRDRVTVSNLASLTFLAEEDDRTLLLTGDAHGNEILRGLDRAGRLDDGGSIHVDVLKIQHHGSEHNIDKEFCRRVTADHYLFCANGEHDNPDPRVVELVASSRKDDRRFKLWFNSSSKASNTERGRAHMEDVEKLVAKLAKASRGRMATPRFLERHSFVVR